MEGKSLRTRPTGTVVLCVLILSLLVAQPQVDAINACCQGPWGATCFSACYASKFTPAFLCLKTCGCKLPNDGNCPPGYETPALSLRGNSAGAINEYCKLGCASYVCDVAISTFKNPREQVVEEAFERCNNACAEFCTKDSTDALQTA